jgi:hypothetical protein
MEHVVGAGVIIATVEPSPFEQFAKNRVVIDYGKDTHVLIKGKSVSLQDPDNRFISVGAPQSGGKPGLTFQEADGSGGVIQKGCVAWFVAKDGEAATTFQLTDTEVSCVTTTGDFWKIDKDFYCLGERAFMVGGAVYLGKAPTVASPILWGVTGIAGIASTCVFVSPA